MYIEIFSFSCPRLFADFIVKVKVESEFEFVDVLASQVKGLNHDDILL